MKLTEKQLAHMFQNSKSTEKKHTVDNLYASHDASDKRLSDVEKIADNSTLSASYQIMNQLQDWSQAVGTDIELSLKPKATLNFFSWFKPTLTAAAVVSAVYFITPNITSDTNNDLIQPQSDKIMFTSSFDNNNDVIGNHSFEQSNETKKNDTISKKSFS
ncbi:MAG: hypothetical protein AB8B80_07355 [Marinicellaceae bacterium]